MPKQSKASSVGSYRIDDSMHDFEQTTFSKNLYDYLCEVIGSERTVHARRVFFKAFDDVFTHRKITTMISSGSKAEGLDMKGSDLDIMTVCHDPVFHDRSEMNTENESVNKYITNFEHSPPGFVLLFRESGYDPSLCVDTEYGTVLSSEKYRAFLKSLQCIVNLQPAPVNMFDIHGPCVVEKFVDIDHACCLKSETLPKIAQQWFERPKNPTWPPSNVVSKMAEAGLLYVPIGSKFGSKESNPFEWRISFSVQEKLLIYSFTHTQLLCYAFLKIILKEIIDTKEETKQLLCSYFMKTVIFWISEEHCISEWKPQCLFSCYQACLQRLVYWVRLGYCPNYFLPEHNMFEGKIYGKWQMTLLIVLEELLSVGQNIVFQSVTLSKFRKKSVSHVLPSEEIDRAIYPLLYIHFKFSPIEIPPRRYLPLLITIITRASKTGLIKSFYFRWLVYYSVQRLVEMPCLTYCANKFFYRQHKTCLFYALMGKNTDVVSGWLWVAAFFYQHADYHKALHITDKIMDECTPDKMFINDTDAFIFRRCLDTSANISFLKRHKLSCIYLLYKTPRVPSVFYNCDLTYDEKVQGIISPPIIFVHFVRAMCYHRLGNIYDRNKSIEYIEATIEEDIFIGSYDLRAYAYSILMRAFQLTNNVVRAEETRDKCLFEIRKDPRFLPTLLSFFC